MSAISGLAKERVLLVDDEPQVLVALEDLLSDEFTVLKADSGERALKLVENEADIAVVVTDQRMPRMTGDEFLARLDGRSDAARMLVTGFADLAAVVRAVNEGRIFAYVAKPWEPEDFRLKVQRAAEHFRLAQELASERRLLRDLMDNTPDGIYFKDAELRFLRANAPVLERLNTEQRALVGKRLSEVLADDPEVAAGELEERRLVEQGLPVLEVTRPQPKNGVVHWYSESKAPIRAPSGAIVGLVGISRDVTLRRQHEARIARLTNVYSLISGINAAIVRARSRDDLLAEACRIAVAAGDLAHAGVARLERETGHATVIASAPEGVPIIQEVAAAQAAQGPQRTPLFEQMIEMRRPMIVNDIAAAENMRFRTQMLAHGLRSAAIFPLLSGGELHSVFCLFGAEPDFFDGEEVKLLGEVSDNLSFALDHIGKSEKLEFLAYHDGLTGLPNRDLFLDRAGQQLVASRKDGRKVGVVIVDLGRFRQINETLGRQGGDRLLIEVAERLRNVAGNVGTVARLFGNTFAVLVPSVESESFVGLLIENEILEALREAFLIEGTEVLASARVGVALFPSDGDTAEALLANAEAALKKSKATGQPYVFYAPVMNARVSEQLALETKLRRAVERDEFLLHYQPKVDLKTGAVVGLEALIRWRDPDTGLVPPGKFIPLLEETGLIREVGRWVLERAALQYHEWLEAGHTPPRIAVNVSGLQLAANDFLSNLERVLQHYPDGSAGIDLEITESVFVDDLDGSIAKLEAARRRGLTVAMDDFGTGYSSLSSLGRLPLDSLKVDRSFVIRMTEDPQSTSIVTTIISLGHALDLKVVAEGVETPEQARLLRLLKCDQAQGYLIARPMPADDVVKMLASRVELSPASKA
ncbi:MAG TPA: EAL domain-containing protein [Polyangiaceae bacterium]|nr:EAL domain-containing protein [Polyangiaceae bacterium]